MVKFIIPIALIAIAIAGFFVFTEPMYQDLRILRQDVAAYNEALDNSKELENERDKLTQQYNEFDPNNLYKLEKLLPNSVDNIRLILEIEKIALPHGMALQDVEYDTQASSVESSNVQAGGDISGVVSSGYGMWELSFSTQGTYANFVRFLKDLERNLRIVDIASIQFSSDTGGAVIPGITEVYKYTVKIKTYWLKN